MKRLMLVLMACLVVVSFSAAQYADAAPKRGGSYNSGNKSFAPKKPADNVSKTDPNKTTTPGTAGAANRGFFSGGGFMKGLMIGGLAGMLFGGLFGGMGFLGDLLGLMVNVLAIFLVVILAMRVYHYFKDRRKPKKGFQE